jgi:uncharacterized protein YPO0396
MQLNVFSTDSHKSGFRLQYMQVLNWGTFDQEIYTLRPGGETSLLTGANASGKTTIVDALLTLMVPEKRHRFYNQSSGTKRKDDRTEESYLLGGFGHKNHEATDTTRTEYLREEKDKAYSILLAHFSNEMEQEVTVFQVRHFAGSELRRYFGLAHKALSIENDFLPFDLSGNWKKALDLRYNKGARRQIEWFDAASRYAQRLVDVLGMQSMQALQLFNHTVGIKVLDNLDDFIRANMLEPRNMEDEFQELKSQLATLMEARRNMEKAEAQINLLSPLSEYHQQAATLRKALDENRQSLEISALWKSYTRHQLLQSAVKQSGVEIESLRKKLTAARQELVTLNEEERKTVNEVEGSKAGLRLKALEDKIQRHEEEYTGIQKNLEKFSKWCDDTGQIMMEPLTEAGYNQLRRGAEKRLEALTAEKQQNETDRFKAQDEKNRAYTEQQSIEQQLGSMQQSRNNMDFRLTELRGRICDSLDIDVAELPFAGELMQVRHDESDWEPALEKLLGGFARRLLVPAKHYKRFNRYVNNNNLRTKLIYEEVTETALLQYAEEGTAPDKLEFHQEHPMAEWLEQEVIRRYRYACLDDERQLDRHERAITMHGLIKDGRRHEKDDRPGRNTAAEFVMGWSNEKKRAALISRRAILVQNAANAEEMLQRCQAREARFSKEFFACSSIAEHGGFEELDLTAIGKAIHKLRDQIDQLQTGNETLNTLRQHLEELRSRKEAASKESDSLLRTETIQEQKLSSYHEEIDSLQPLLSALGGEDKERLLAFQQEHAEILGTVGLQNIEDVYFNFRQRFLNQQEDLQDSLFSEERKIQTQINRIKNPVTLIQRFPDWPADVQHLPEDPRYVGEYTEWLEKLRTENLPKYRRDFENFINITITHKVAGMKEALDKWERDIEQHVERLNESLAGINFNRLPDTFIQLGRRRTPAGSEIREFRHQLLEALPQAANWQSESFESKAQHFTEKVQPLIERLDLEEAYRRQVLDVRNWFEFWADERYRSDKEVKKIYRQMGQLSGGEKAQLTYTILCSAIAYQFGITREGAASKSLRFIAVDESFSNQDEEKSTYLMELCRELHLQLLVVTPSDKIHIVQDFIAHVHLTQRINNRNSTLYNMTIKELQERNGMQPVAEAVSVEE